MVKKRTSDSENFNITSRPVSAPPGCEPENRSCGARRGQVVKVVWWSLLVASFLGAFVVLLTGLRMQVEGVGLSWPMTLGMVCLLFAVGYFASCRISDIEEM